MPKAIPDGLTESHIVLALNNLDAGVEHPFGPPTGYELVHKGKRYPPKAVVGLAFKYITGNILGFEEFSGGEAPGQANFVLRNLGFVVVGKDSPVPSDATPAWRMAFRAGKNDHEMWPDCYRLGIAAIEYSPVDDIDFSLYSKGEPKEAWSELEISQRKSLERFVYEMKEGHLIYVKQGPNIVGKGVVAGPYRFDKQGLQEPNSGAFWQHQRRVIWTSKFLNLRIQVGQSQQYVVEALPDEDVSRIEHEVAQLSLLAADAEDAESNNGPAYVAQSDDRRAVVLRQIRERRGQQQFRESLRKRYKDRCLVTGCPVVDVLEAAHIDPYRNDDNNNSENGLLLRADIHTLFDLNLLGIEPDSLRVDLHPILAAEYGNLVGKTLVCPENLRPSSDALKRRYEQFQKRVHGSL